MYGTASQQQSDPGTLQYINELHGFFSKFIRQLITLVVYGLLVVMFPGSES